MNIITRMSEKRDIKKLIELDNITWNNSNSPALIIWENEDEYESKNPLDNLIVAELNGEVCGFISMKQPTKLPSNSHVVEIAIAVDPTVRKQGIGTILIKESYDWGKKNGKSKMSLRVLSTNEPAINLYLKCGFSIQGRLVDEFLIENKYVDDIFMYKLIEE